jgi:hypothetical protein
VEENQKVRENKMKKCPLQQRKRPSCRLNDETEEFEYIFNDDCIQSECAWWNEMHQGCAVEVISRRNII